MVISDTNFPHKISAFLPSFNLAQKGTGVVTSVPADSPDDFVQLRDWKNSADKRKKFGIDESWVQPFEVINVVKSPWNQKEIEDQYDEIFGGKKGKKKKEVKLSEEEQKLKEKCDSELIEEEVAEHVEGKGNVMKKKLFCYQCQPQLSLQFQIQVWCSNVIIGGQVSLKSGQVSLNGVSLSPKIGQYSSYSLFSTQFSLVENMVFEGQVGRRGHVSPYYYITAPYYYITAPHLPLESK